MNIARLTADFLRDRPLIVAQGAFALLALANAGLVFGGAFWLTAVKVDRLETSFVQKVTAEAQSRSAEMATKVFAPPAGVVAKSTDELSGIAERLRKIDGEGVEFELAVAEKANRSAVPRVVVASEAALNGQIAEGGLLQTLRGERPPAEIMLPGANRPGSTYTAYYVHRIAGGFIEVAGTHAIVPPPPRALRVIRRTVKKHVASPAGTYTIQSGDTLYKIARTHYQDETRFNDIWLANRGVLGDDSAQLPVGTVIQLPAGPEHEVEVEQNVVVYPSAAPVIESGHPALPRRRAIGPSQVALKLIVPVRTREAAMIGDRQRALLLGAIAAVGTVLAWWIGFLLLGRQRRRLLAEQQQSLLSLLASRIQPHSRYLDRTQLRSPWQVEHAAAVLAGQEAGGSFTDFQVFGDTRLDLFIGDATGWNTTALVYRGLTDLLWRATVADGLGARDTLLEVNRHLVDYISQGDHVAAFYAQVDLMSGAVVYVAAAQTGAFVLGRRGGLTMLSARGLPLGVGQQVFAGRLEESHMRLQEGESLLLFTDGLLRAENVEGEPFGIGRLEKCLRERPGCEAEQIVATIRQAVEAFTGDRLLSDEAAIICVRLVNPLVLYPKLVAEPITSTLPTEPDLFINHSS